jgi:hypothetical protein
VFDFQMINARTELEDRSLHDYEQSTHPSRERKIQNEMLRLQQKEYKGEACGGTALAFPREVSEGLENFLVLHAGRMPVDWLIFSYIQNVRRQRVRSSSHFVFYVPFYKTIRCQLQVFEAQPSIFQHVPLSTPSQKCRGRGKNIAQMNNEESRQWFGREVVDSHNAELLTRTIYGEEQIEALDTSPSFDQWEMPRPH